MKKESRVKRENKVSLVSTTAQCSQLMTITPSGLIPQEKPMLLVMFFPYAEFFRKKMVM